MKLDTTALVKTYDIVIRPPFRRGNKRYDKWGKINMCFMTPDNRAFLYESPVTNVDCRQLWFRFDGPAFEEGIDRVLLRSYGACNVNEVSINDIKYIPSWDNTVVFTKEREFNSARYRDNMNAYRAFKEKSLYGGSLATLMGSGAILVTDGGAVNIEAFGIGACYGLLYQILLQYDVDTMSGDKKLPLVLPIRLGLLILLIMTLNEITYMDPHIFILGIMGFMTNKVGLIWAESKIS